VLLPAATSAGSGLLQILDIGPPRAVERRSIMEPSHLCADRRASAWQSATKASSVRRACCAACSRPRRWAECEAQQSRFSVAGITHVLESGQLASAAPGCDSAHVLARTHTLCNRNSYLDIDININQTEDVRHNCANCAALHVADF
jgi:hypothetical protein